MSHNDVSVSPASFKPADSQFTVGAVLRELIALVLLVGVGWYVYLHHVEVGSTLDAVRSGSGSWLAVAFLGIVLYYVDMAVYIRDSLALLGIRLTVAQVLPIRVGTEAASIMTPTEFLAMQAYFALIARRMGLSNAAMGLGLLVTQIAEFMSFLLVLAVGLVALILRHQLQTYEITACFVLLIVVIASVAAIISVILHPDYPRRFLSRFSRSISRLMKVFGFRLRLSKDHLDSIDRHVHEIVMTIRQETHKLWRIVGLALIGHLLRIVCLGSIILAFHLVLSPLDIVIAYSIGNLVWMISPVPQGIGLVEGAYGLILTSLGVASGAAATVALAYRGFTFWLPLAAGAIASRQLQRE